MRALLVPALLVASALVAVAAVVGCGNASRPTLDRALPETRQRMQLVMRKIGGYYEQLAESVDYKSLVKSEQLVVDDSTEPLRMQAEAFRDTVVNGTPPVVSAEDGLAAVQVANDIINSVKSYRWDGKVFGRKGLDVIQKDG